MKTRTSLVGLLCAAFLLCVSKAGLAQPQGKVVINEYMPWTSNGCGTTSEFVELLNFGPGPVDIGCYILTTGVYSITIPKNTIIRPGEFYVLAGKDFIPGNCANIDSSASGVHADLNWNSCNCTNVSIPTTGDGLMTDGGSSNTPLVLLDPSLKIIDAVVRNTPTEPTQLITSASMAGACSAKTFNIGTMSPAYEVLGMSAGRGNSFARRVDGDCGWVKDPQQSANATNNRGGATTTDISYSLSMVSPTSCEGAKGSAVIYVLYSNYAAIFPMTYILAQDIDNNGTFDITDKYDTYVDSTPPYIEINNLPVGHFRITVASSKDCYLKTFEFTTIPCDPALLPVKLLSFKNKEIVDKTYRLEWLIENVENVQNIVIEKATGDSSFVLEKIVTNEANKGLQLHSELVSADPLFPYFRLKVIQKGGGFFYSPIVSTKTTSSTEPHSAWPNPATDKINLAVPSMDGAPMVYVIYDMSGRVVGRGKLVVNKGERFAQLKLPAVAPGYYQVTLSGTLQMKQPISFRFVKH